MEMKNKTRSMKLNKFLSIFYPPIFRNCKVFLYNGIFEWILFIIGFLIWIFYTPFGFLFMVFWIENFIFGIIPVIFKKIFRI